MEQRTSPDGDPETEIVLKTCFRLLLALTIAAMAAVVLLALVLYLDAAPSAIVLPAVRPSYPSVPSSIIGRQTGAGEPELPVDFATGLFQELASTRDRWNGVIPVSRTTS